LAAKEGKLVVGKVAEGKRKEKRGKREPPGRVETFGCSLLPIERLNRKKAHS